MSEDQDKIKITLPSKLIKFLASDNLSLQLIFLKHEKDGYVSSHINLDTDSMEEIRKSCQKFMKYREKWDELEYSVEQDNDKKHGVFRTITANQIPNKGNILKKDTTLEDTITKELTDKTKWIGFRFENKEHKFIFLLKKISSNYFVLTEHKKFHFVIKGIAKLFDDNLVKFPGDFDVVQYGDTLLIFNPYQFEELFSYHLIHEEYRKQVFNYFRKRADYKIHNLDLYEGIIMNNKSLLRKFGPIIEKQIYNKKLTAIQKVLKIRKVKTLQIDGKTLKFDSSKALVNFFNDNHLTSLFTKKNYTVHSKTEE